MDSCVCGRYEKIHFSCQQKTHLLRFVVELMIISRISRTKLSLLFHLYVPKKKLFSFCLRALLVRNEFMNREME